ncbi:glutathione-disulfide reductase [Thioalkalivibrio paradoxus]|uniref:Glutathione reductase n=1 Tax=Thioalkalivibrio paradoxus ARh 1 TaxID=713585 RepID=W0DJV8_9GAMM|nr:glutathione-disulfide reductase [Thioalkalivibrio paradoxus]AHE98899.1 glutathione reductase [Thioalkalivibrio paradoxus ARh 1]
MEQYDVIVIGGGSGGLAVAERAAGHGARVVVFDPKPLGGTCVNEGCVPKKLTWYAAHHIGHARHAAEFGVDLQFSGIRYPDLVQRRHAFLRMLNDYWSGYLERLGVEYVPERAQLLDERTVSAGGKEYRGERVVIATGGEPLVPRMPGHELGATSDDFFQWTDLPKSIAIIGAGYIGLEMAGMLRAFGTEVTVVAMEDRVLEMFDPMVSHVLERHLGEQGIERRLGATVNGLAGEPGAVRVQIADGSELGPFERVLWAVGRSPKTRDIGLESTGVKLRPNGTVPVDEWQQTNVPGVFALGDIVGKGPLTPVAIAAGRRLADRWFAPERNPVPVDYSQIPTVTFTHPPTAAVGMTEPQAVARYGDQVHVYETEFGGLARAFAEGDIAPVSMKLVCAGDDERVVGIHMVGDGVDEMLQGFAVAVRMGATKRDFDLTIPIHPTSAEELVTLKVSRPGQSDPIANAG